MILTRSPFAASKFQKFQDNRKSFSFIISSSDNKTLSVTQYVNKNHSKNNENVVEVMSSTNMFKLKDHNIQLNRKDENTVKWDKVLQELNDSIRKYRKVMNVINYKRNNFTI